MSIDANRMFLYYLHFFMSSRILPAVKRRTWHHTNRRHILRKRPGMARRLRRNTRTVHSYIRDPWVCHIAAGAADITTVPVVRLSTTLRQYRRIPMKAPTWAVTAPCSRRSATGKRRPTRGCRKDEEVIRTEMVAATLLEGKLSRRFFKFYIISSFSYFQWRSVWSRGL